MASRGDDQHLRRLITEYFGGSSRLRLLRSATAFGASVFVVDFDRGARHFRTFGSFGPSFGTANPEAPQVTEQSSMDLLYPARLVFHYERLMSLAFAMSARSVNAMLLGVGGAAMWRFLSCSISLHQLRVRLDVIRFSLTRVPAAASSKLKRKVWC